MTFHAEVEGQVNQTLSEDSFIRVLISLTREEPSWPNCLVKILLLNTITLTTPTFWKRHVGFKSQQGSISIIWQLGFIVMSIMQDTLLILHWLLLEIDCRRDAQTDTLSFSYLLKIMWLMTGLEIGKALVWGLHPALCPWARYFNRLAMICSSKAYRQEHLLQMVAWRS